MQAKCVILILVVLAMSCGKRSDDQELSAVFIDTTAKPTKMWEQEVLLKEYFEGIEKELREDHGMTDQGKIDQVVQMLINDHDIETPFIMDENGPRFVKYIDYKKYRAMHPIDTIERTYIIHSDVRPYYDSSAMATDTTLKSLNTH